MARMYKGSVTDTKKGIVQSIMDMYEQGKLLTYFDIQKERFDVPLEYFYRYAENGAKRSDYDNVTELDLVDVYGIKGLYERIKGLDDNGDYDYEMTYQDLAYTFDKELEKAVFKDVKAELNSNVLCNRQGKSHDSIDLQSYVVLLADVEKAINTLYDKYCRD